MTPKLTASIAKPSDATAYAAGDHLANSLTANLVVPMAFVLPGDSKSGRVTGARCVIKPASGNVVITALDLDLLLFRPTTDMPFAPAGFPADNAALALTEAQMQQLVGVVPFVTGAWRNPAGALTAGAAGWQSVAIASRDGYRFNVDGCLFTGLVGIVQAKGAWTPGAVAQALTFDLDVEV